MIQLLFSKHSFMVLRSLIHRQMRFRISFTCGCLVEYKQFWGHEPYPFTNIDFVFRFPNNASNFNIILIQIMYLYYVFVSAWNSTGSFIYLLFNAVARLDHAIFIILLANRRLSVKLVAQMFMFMYRKCGESACEVILQINNYFWQHIDQD